MKKFCDKKFCKKSTSDSEGEVLICGHAYHEECFRVLGLKCEHCYKYLDKSIDELTKSYNQRLHLKETQLELNDEEIAQDREQVTCPDYRPRRRWRFSSAQLRSCWRRMFTNQSILYL